MPVLAFGRDRRWASHLQRVLVQRGEFDWRGVLSAQAMEGARPGRAIWLLDGDDIRCQHLRGDAQQSARIYFYTQPDVSALRHCARLAGSGCLDKNAAPEVILRALRAVETGLFAVDSALLARALAAERRAPAPVDNLSHLTDRQREIVHWAAMGMSNKQIGRRLGISPETVKSHLHQVFEREGISGRVALLALHRPEAHTNGADEVIRI
ncbi:helix-turn-helix transcriptional regulator [Agrilutibacter solisilvae]|uniref:Response regulator transcription factor n=1 Tax=Agrilutibacter solisilvae TaxID=2763317 RepID=A0A975ATF9_9GAMM|nr:LuxR C-terminal-related transcriptional regulator [Lysobacter solisilvae]QSX78970.1 response regulator transcription factor [Lysobacter solisilvae]